jgi:hypothetical protein
MSYSVSTKRHFETLGFLTTTASSDIDPSWPHPRHLAVLLPIEQVTDALGSHFGYGHYRINQICR